MWVKPVKGWFCPNFVIPDGDADPGPAYVNPPGSPLSAALRRG